MTDEMVVGSAVALSTPVEMIRVATTDPNVDPAKLRELLAVKREWEADEARKAFAIDFAAFQAECPIIAPLDKGNKNNFARIDRIWRETRPLRNKYGLAVAWLESTVDDSGMCHLRGLLTHKSGHAIDVAQDMPLPEEIKNREGKLVTNASQSMGIAMTYAKRYGDCAILGIVTGNDTDGYVPQIPITAEQCKILTQAIKVAGAEYEAKVLEFGGVERLQDLPADKFPAAMKAVNKHINENNG